MAQWADFSGPPPGAGPLIRAGFTGVIRYIGLGSEGKQIHRSEYEDYTRNGMPVLLVAELGTNDAWVALDDYATGVARAQAALADARAEGIPDYVGIACAADAHATSKSQIADAVRYAQGFASVLGKDRTGFYGFSETSVAVHDAGVVGWHWRCGSAPSDSDKAWVNFWQRNDGTKTVNGIVCDINETFAPLEGDMATPQELWEGYQVQVLDAKGDPIPDYRVAAENMLAETNRAAWLLVNKLDVILNTVTDSEAGILAAVRAQPTGGQVDTADLSARLTASLGPSIAAELGRRLTEGNPQ